MTMKHLIPTHFLMVPLPWLPVTALLDPEEYCCSVKTVAKAWPKNPSSLPVLLPVLKRATCLRELGISLPFQLARVTSRE